MPFPVDTKFVNATEQKLGVRFPASFVVRMTKHNGGTVVTRLDSWQLYPVLDTSDRIRLKRSCNDIVAETKQAKQWHGFPANAVAIAGNGTGDQLVLVPRPDAPDILGPPYWWDHETGDLNFVCDDFGDINQ
jgi:hypothetical protein